MILIIGCGRLGASLANRLTSAGYQVVVVDHLRENFQNNLPRDFQGKTIVGMEIDANVLKRAGIERASAVVCVSRDENTNMMAADVARLQFGIENVTVRIDQPQLVDAYRAKGYDVISPVIEATNALETALRSQKGEVL